MSKRPKKTTKVKPVEPLPKHAHSLSDGNHTCQHPTSISYEPDKSASEPVWEEITEQSTDTNVHNCTTTAKYVMLVNGVPTHFCDRHFKSVTRSRTHDDEYGTYGDPTSDDPNDEPCDPKFTMGD
jgi:hypothetical protein